MGSQGVNVNPVAELEELYDDRTIAALDRAVGEPPPTRVIEARRPRMAGALLQASSLAARRLRGGPTGRRGRVPPRQG
jgi:hypothetical protein